MLFITSQNSQKTEEGKHYDEVTLYETHPLGSKKIRKYTQKDKEIFQSFFLQRCNRIGTKMKIEKKITVIKKIEKSLLGGILLNKCPILVMRYVLDGKKFGGKT